jgi:Flp pilus assembly protein TadB
MEIIAVILALTAAASLAGSIAIVVYRQKALRDLKGGKTLSVTHKALEALMLVKKNIIKANSGLTDNKRYEKIYFNLVKINADDRMDKGSFLFAEQAAAVSLLILGLIAFGDVFISMGLGAAGFFIPWLVLQSKVRKKEDAILRELPDALDIIAANIEGGLSLNQAVSRYAARNRNAFSDELMTVIKKMQMGQSSEEALRGLDNKLAMKDVSSFINAFLQAEKMGGNVKKIIKGQAEEVRKRRFQHLKKLAHEAPVKLLIPLMIFIFPVIFIVLFGPIIIKVMQGF